MRNCTHWLAKWGLLCWVFGCAPGLSTARAQNNLPAAKAAPAPPPADNVPLAVLPFTLQSNEIILSIPMTQAGPGEPYRVPKEARPFRLMLDTGAYTLILLEEAFTARQISLPPKDENNQASIVGNGEGGAVSARFVPGGAMRIGAVPLQGRFLVTSSKPLSDAGIDGAVGDELFRACIVEIDYAKKIVRLFDPPSYTPPAFGSGFVTIPIRFSGEHKLPAITVEVTPSGFGKKTANLIIDTGDNGTLSLNAPFVQRSGWQALEAKTAPAVGTGINGTTNERRGRLKQLSLGGIALDAPSASFSFDKRGTALIEGSDGTLGNEILRRFTAVFDYSRNALYLRPNADIHTPFDFPKQIFGFRLADTASEFGGKRIEDVLAGSPVARAGIKAGETLYAIDRKPVGKLSQDEFSRLLDARTDTRVFTVGDAKGGNKRDVRVTPMTL